MKARSLRVPSVHCGMVAVSLLNHLFCSSVQLQAEKQPVVLTCVCVRGELVCQSPEEPRTAR